jgi:hypothetical protein
MKCRRLIKRRDSQIQSGRWPRVSLSTGIFQYASVYDSVVRTGFTDEENVELAVVIEFENLLDERLFRYLYKNA